jgi:hypothetical protein
LAFAAPPLDEPEPPPLDEPEPPPLDGPEPPLGKPAPPLDVVPVPTGFVAAVVGGEVVELAEVVLVWVVVVLVLVGMLLLVVVVGVVGGDVVVVVVLVVELACVGVEVALEQSWAASCETVAAPCPRFWIRVLLTPRGSEATSSEKRCAAAAAAPQSPAETAAETELSSALSRAD